MAKEFVAYMYSDEAAKIFAQATAIQPITGVSDYLQGDNKMLKAETFEAPLKPYSIASLNLSLASSTAACHSATVLKSKENRFLSPYV